MMRTFSKMILASGLVVLMVAPAMAQRPGRGFGGFGGGGSGAMLVANKGVQQELKVDEAQAEKLDALAQELGDKQRAEFQKLQDVSQDERREKMQEIGQAMNADLRKGLDKVLKPEQVKRFEQIQLQQSGINAFAMPRVQEDLKLTDEQKSKFREISEEQSQAIRGAFSGARDDREGAMRKVADARKQANEKAQAVLTDDQKKTWKEMTGEPFEVRFEFRRPNNQ